MRTFCLAVSSVKGGNGGRGIRCSPLVSWRTLHYSLGLLKYIGLQYRNVDKPENVWQIPCASMLFRGS